jgi:hypothetical protein
VDPLRSILPVFDACERHRRQLEVPPAAAIERVLALPAAPDRVTRLLFFLRGISAGRGESLAAFGRRRLGFSELSRTANSVAWGRTGRLSLAIAFWAEDDGVGGSIVYTETRVLSQGRGARRIFRVYWLIVRPFSGLIRRRWLRAVARA